MSTVILPTKPSGYAVCFRNECPKAKNCLRNIVAQEPNEDQFITIVNPILQKDISKGCSCYRPNQIVKIAYGISRIYDNVPYAKKKSIMFSIQGLFSKTTYYRIYRKERHLWPKEQQAIQQIFNSYEIKEPVVFDEYHEVIDW